MKFKVALSSPFSALLSCVESESESASDGKVKTAGVCPAPSRNRFSQSQPLLAARGSVGQQNVCPLTHLRVHSSKHVVVPDNTVLLITVEVVENSKIS